MTLSFNCVLTMVKRALFCKSWRWITTCLGFGTVVINNGCFLENIDANKEYAYVLKKGSPERITQWMLSQKDPGKINDGLAALQDIFDGRLVAVSRGKADSDRLLREADEASRGIVEMNRRSIATAELSMPPSDRLDISAEEADGLVRWVIPYYAKDAARRDD